MFRKYAKAFALTLFAAFINAFAIPPPVEYSMAMLQQDLKQAHLVALGEVIQIDTIPFELDSLLAVDPPFLMNELRVNIKIIKCYKGDIEAEGSLVHTKKNLNLVGGYDSRYEQGLQSIICFYDGFGDGVFLTVNPRGKFDLHNDSIIPPPVGFGFTDEFDYSQTFTAFEFLLQETIRHQEYLQFMPVLPRNDQDIHLKTSIDISGGATLDVSLWIPLFLSGNLNPVPTLPFARNLIP
jgi:hypothetical protein